VPHSLETTSIYPNNTKLSKRYLNDIPISGKTDSGQLILISSG